MAEAIVKYAAAPARHARAFLFAIRDAFGRRTKAPEQLVAELYGRGLSPHDIEETFTCEGVLNWYPSVQRTR